MNELHPDAFDTPGLDGGALAGFESHQGSSPFSPTRVGAKFLVDPSHGYVSGVFARRLWQYLSEACRID